MKIMASPQTTPVASQFGDRLTHQILDLNINSDAGDGSLRTICGKWIIPAPMISDIERSCPICTWMITSEIQEAERQSGRRWLINLRARMRI
jgi:hypothetical protein